ncbi:hypothetical protein HON36_05350 [Candidatus Parcubacteria bacterium]|jgi:hypothetical protein|nr:hypothetical protein [Candidatus Parcubacteria bacterium]MBT7228232.1 hypothetical protein [Candidatus Parcubacteria bacterium]
MKKSRCQKLIDSFKDLKIHLAVLETNGDDLVTAGVQKQQVEHGLFVCENDLESVVFDLLKTGEFSADGIVINFVSDLSDTIKIQIFPMGQKRDLQKIKEAALVEDFDTIFPDSKLISNVLKILTKNKHFKVDEVLKIPNGTIHITLEN